MKWIFVFLVLIGDYLVVKKIRFGFYLWVLVDGYFSICHFLQNDYVEASVFGLYAIMGLYGLYLWKSKE